MQNPSRLVLERRVKGPGVTITTPDGYKIRVLLSSTKAGRARLAFEADRNVRLTREELH